VICFNGIKEVYYDCFIVYIADVLFSSVLN